MSATIGGWRDTFSVPHSHQFWSWQPSSLGTRRTYVSVNLSTDQNVFLMQELSTITDQQALTDLRNADRRAGHWLAEDPTLERMLAWIRIQR